MKTPKLSWIGLAGICRNRNGWEWGYEAASSPWYYRLNCGPFRLLIWAKP